MTWACIGPVGLKELALIFASWTRSEIAYRYERFVDCHRYLPISIPHTGLIYLIRSTYLCSGIHSQLGDRLLRRCFKELTTGVKNCFFGASSFGSTATVR
jgi:hypothetical protein